MQAEQEDVLSDILPIRVGVIGAGQMGAGIAQVSAASGFQTLLYDQDSAAVKNALSGIEKRFKRLVEKEVLSEGEAEAAKGHLQPVDDLSGFSHADFVIEAIVENAEVKESLFSKLSEIVTENSILASNTSSISITRIAKASSNPANVIGMHFMNPVPVMKLVEVIRGLQTSDETYERTVDLAEKFQKTTVQGIDAPGFIVNRILCPMINEAIFLLQEGVAAPDIDQAMKLGTNQPMGPLELADFVGLDTLLYILQLLHRELGEDKYRPCPLLAKYVEAGWYGKKSGKGFYEYAD